MKYDKGILTEADIKKRQRFWNKRGFFGTPTYKELERRSKKMQELLFAIKDMTYGEISDIRKLPSYTSRVRRLNKQQTIVRQAYENDLEYALRIAPKTFKVNQ